MGQLGDTRAHVEFTRAWLAGEAPLPDRPMFHVMIAAMSCWRDEPERLMGAAHMLLSLAIVARYAVGVLLALELIDPHATLRKRTLKPHLVAMGASITALVTMPWPHHLTRAWEDGVYIDSALSNQFHSPTEHLSVVFSITATTLLLRYLRRGDRASGLWHLFILFLGILAKPSFSTVALPAFAGIVLLRTIRRRRIDGVLIGYGFLHVVLLAIAGGIFGPGSVDDSRVEIDLLAVWRHRVADPLPPAVAGVAWLIPWTAAMLLRRERRELALVMITLATLAVAQYALLSEVGPRRWHMNFVWSAKAVWAILSIVVPASLLGHMMSDERRWRQPLLIVAVAAWLATLVSGLMHIRGVWLGWFIL